MSIGYLLQFVVLDSAAIKNVSYALSVFQRLFGFILLAIWGTTLYRTAGRESASTLAAAFLVAGVVQASIGMLLLPVAEFVCSLAPVLSAIFYVRVQHLAKLTETRTTPFSSEGDGFEAADPKERHRKQGFASSVVLVPTFVCLFLYGMLAFALHSNWLPARADEASAAFIQIFSALGTISAAIALMAMQRVAPKNLIMPLCKMLAFIVLIAAVLVVVFSKNYSQASLFTSLLDASHKLALFIVWITPFYARGRRSHLSLFALSLAVYQLGALVGNIALSFESVDIFVFLLCPLALCVEFSISLARLLLGGERANRSGSGFADQSDASFVEAGATLANVEAYDRILFMVYLSDAFRLTKREFEVAQLLAQGMSTKDVAEHLVISPETAKTHRRNVFQKMKVSSQKELEETMERAREKDFPEFKRSVSAHDYFDDAIEREHSPDIVS